MLTFGPPQVTPGPPFLGQSLYWKRRGKKKIGSVKGDVYSGATGHWPVARMCVLILNGTNELPSLV